jgi:signal transduction histidine kinase
MASQDGTPKMHRSAPGFFWQGALTLLPVAVLAVVGFVSLRQDRRLAELEASERAQALADDLAGKLWDEPISGNAAESDGWFEVHADGNLASPPPLAPLIPECLEPRSLSSEQARLWRVARNCESIERDAAAAMDAYRRFIESGPPTNFAAAAHFSLGLLLAETKEGHSTANAFALVMKQFDLATGETGLRFGPLAALKTMEVLSTESGPEATAMFSEAQQVLQRHAFNYPNAMTGHLLERALKIERALGDKSMMPRITEAHSATPQGAKVEKFSGVFDFTLNRWRQHEQMRTLYAAARPHFSLRTGTNNLLPAVFWFEAPEFKPAGGSASFDASALNASNVGWLAVASLATAPDRHSYRCVQDSHLTAALRGYVRDRARLPEYFGVSVAVAGRSVLSTNDLVTFVAGSAGKPASAAWIRHPGSAAAVLASARRTEGGTECLRLNMHLTSPQMLFAHQRARARVFGLLIGVAVAVAVIGFVAARRSFLRQQRLAEMKSNFVSSVSHELRAPIASVRLMAEGLERGKVGERAKQHEYFRLIVQECRRLSSMIENVLDFARIEQGRKEYEFEPCDVVALVVSTVKGLEPYAAERSVTLTLKLPSNDAARSACSATMDARAIQQALVNLLDNAIKHSPPGAAVVVALEATACPSTQGNGPSVPAPRPSSPVPEGDFRSEGELSLLRLSVADHGPGIPPNEQEKIFERFYRLGSELRRETPGVGIGLSIVQHIAEAHGGRVRLESGPGQGSRFIIELPLAAKFEPE